MNQEEATIRAFMIPQKRRRYVECLSNPKKRGKFREELAHFGSLDPRFILSIPPDQQNLDSVQDLLRSMGAGPKCWVISENSDLDGREVDLESALGATIGHGMGTIISCIPGRLGYFEDEDGRCILRR